MIITRTPYRVSFFGGGTDYPTWYRKHGGQVLSTTINKFVYITCRYLPPFFDHKLRLAYSIIEECSSVDEIQHPSAREVLRYLDINQGIEIHYDGDLPSRSGMGSSSAFTVGLLKTLHAHKGEMVSTYNLSREAIHVEQDLVKETVGSQDQVSAAYGGLNRIKFLASGEIVVSPVIMKDDRRKSLEENLMLFYTGVPRTAAEVASTYESTLDRQVRSLQQLSQLVDEGIELLMSDKDLDEFGRLLDITWREKCKLSANISSSYLDEIYSQACSAGALGGKIVGAGGGGMMLLYVPRIMQDKVKATLSQLLYIPFKFEASGSQVIFNKDSEHSMVG